MSDDRLEQLSRFVAQQSAEVEALRTLLQCLVVTMLAGFPKNRELFLAWQKASLDRLDKETKLGENEDKRRIYELAGHAARTIFDEIAPAFGIATPSGSSN